jgi:hypothetical protein
VKHAKFIDQQDHHIVGLATIVLKNLIIIVHFWYLINNRVLVLAKEIIDILYFIFWIY